jgi:hypothetical protein
MIETSAASPLPASFTAHGWRSDMRNTRAAVAEVVRAAIGEIGTCEAPLGSNAGPVLKYGGEPGQPWCAYFTSWCYRRAEGGSPFGVLASAYKLREWAAGHGRVLADGYALHPGDVALVLREDLHGHVALVVADVGGGMIATVEGNVRSAVRGLVREARAEFNCFIRPLPLP